jgi:hypothetical protein
MASRSSLGRAVTTAGLKTICRANVGELANRILGQATTVKTEKLS